MYQPHNLGKKGEEIACIYIKKNKYKILEKNFRYRKYEIDIIAKEEKEIVFIEVKTRSSKICGLPAESVTPKKKKHIYKAASFYLHIHGKENAYCRFDVIEIYFYKKSYYIHHIKQVI